MGSLLGYLCVLSALTATGLSLTCKVCRGNDFDSCSGTNMTCPPDNVCGGSRALTTAHKLKLADVFTIGCVPKHQCNTLGSISTAYRNIKMGTSCCETDYCTPPSPTLPDDDFKPNGLTCQTCVSANSDWCYTDDTFQCIGNENMCILQSTNSYGSSKLSTALRGCATKSICDFGNQSSTSGGVNTKVSISCTSGSFALRSSQFVSSVIAIAVAKMMYF
ncbi:phospholipase A2 inhibitor NAI-like [Mixophyes fleayi]|uniref:phospholipase A2 inhibitor NAI-like n=1 Tax=Mixophyes fleayi TaxID=3061075 RepID=UPI003F4DF7D4